MHRILLAAAILVFHALCACNSQRSPGQPAAENTTMKNDSLKLLTGKKWILKQLNGQAIVDTSSNGASKPIFLQFSDTASTVNGFGGCNGYGGKFELKSGNRIIISQVVSTMMACEKMEIENQLFRVFEMADNYFCDGQKLQLNKARMAPLAVFELAPLTQ